MTQFNWRAGLAGAFGLFITLSTWAPLSGAAPAPQAAVGQGADHARIVAYWTAERRAAAIPRDLVLDAHGQAYLRMPDGALHPYGLTVAAAARAIVPQKKPVSDTTPPAIKDMDPVSGATIGASYTFKATVTDTGGVKSVSFSVAKDGSPAQSFTASLTTNNIWTASLSGFTDGDWSWWVVAKDKAGNTATSSAVSFTVATGGGGGDVVVNVEWPADGVVQTATGRLYFEMPANKSRRSWVGYVCSGTVTTDETTGRSVILTAAHCVYDDANKAFARKVMFIPDQAETTGSGTDLDCSNDPLGCWTPTFGVVDENWTTRTFPDNIEWDYGFYVVSDTGAHQDGFKSAVDVLDTVAGHMDVNFSTAPYHDGSSNAYTWAFGYSYSEDPKLMYCAEGMTVTGTVNWWLASCGLSGGSSGGPWFQLFTDSGNSVGSGTIVSVNSWGYTNAPGMAGPKLDAADSTASCVFADAKVISLDIWSGTVDGKAGEAVTCP